MAKQIHPEEITLSNGIPVILQHYEGAVATTYWWVKTGSTDENPHEAGFAHFLEHMLFKDAAAKETGQASTGKMARAIESLGGDINAYTSFDQTVYHVTCAAHHWENILDAFGTIAKPQKFLKDDFEREREVILEELRKNEDSPGRQLFQNLFSSTFKKHPYGKPVIGYAKTLKAAKVGQLEAFYKRNYVSENMGIILVGPIQDEKGARRNHLIKLLEKHFGSKVIAKKKASPITKPLDSQLLKSNYPTLKTKSFDVKTPSISFSFRVPDLNHSDIPALDLLCGILGMGELSRIYQHLFYQTSLVTDASGGLYVPRDPGMMYFQMELNDISKVNSASEEFFKVLKKMKEEGPTEDELKRVLVNAESDRLYSTQTVDGFAGRLGFLKFIMGDLNYDQKYLEELHSVDAAKIREAAVQYLEPRRLSIVALIPKSEENFDLSELGQSAVKILGEPSLPLKETRPHASKKNIGKDIPVEVFELPSGLRVAYLERTQSNVFSVHASALGGLRLELAKPLDRRETDWGTSYMMSLTWTKGTLRKNSQQIAALVEGNAASLDGFSGRNSIGLQMTGLSRDWGKLSEVLSEVLIEPTFPETEIEHSRRITEDALRGIEDHSSQLCSKLFLETLFEKHPYGKLTYGSMESLKTIDQRKMKAFHQLWVKPKGMVLSISGPIKRAALETWLKELSDRFGNIQGKTKTDEDLPFTLEDESQLKAPRWVERNLSREQTHILVGGLGTKIYAEDRHGLRLLQTLLGGQSGRLFIELREKKSLAYSVSPISFEGMERGYVGTYIACAPQKKQEAIDGIKTVLENLSKKGPTAAEMNRAKEFYLGRRAMDLQGDTTLAAHYGLETLYGIQHLSETELIKKIRSISAKDIQKLCHNYLVEPFMVTSIVG